MSNPQFLLMVSIETNLKLWGSLCNAGRLRRIPLILSAVETYYNLGGKLSFVFAGGGVHAKHLKEFCKKFPYFTIVDW